MCGRWTSLVNVVDEYTREALEMLVARSIDADRTVEVLERLVAERGAPEHLRCDNGTELTSHALRDWCRFSKTETAFIEPGSPWQNAYVESFNGRVRDELLDIEEFSCLADARVVIVPAASAHHPALNTRPGVTRSRPMAPTPDAARAPRRVPPLGRWLRREYSSRSR